MNENAEISACKKHQNPKAKKRQRPMIIIIIPIPDQDLLWPVYGFYLGYFLSSIPPNGPGPYGMTELSATRMGYRDTCYLGPRIQEMQCICYDIDPRYSRNPKKSQESFAAVYSVHLFKFADGDAERSRPCYTCHHPASMPTVQRQRLVQGFGSLAGLPETGHQSKRFFLNVCRV